MRYTILAVTLAFAPVIALAQTPGTKLADFQADGRARMLQADTDNDGRISKAEWTPRSGRNSEAAFRQIESNADGMLDQNELNALLERRFKRMDANGAGQLTAGERQASR